MSNEVVAVLCTFPNAEDAASIARRLVEERLVACVNLVPGVRSIYRWDGAICDDAEILGVMKTTRGQFDAMCNRLVELHPAAVPEVLALPCVAGHLPYLDWVRAETPA